MELRILSLFCLKMSRFWATSFSLCFILCTLLQSIFSRSIPEDYAIEIGPTGFWYPLKKFQGNSNESIKPLPNKRRLVIRIPYSQEPNSMQLARIYHTLYSPPKQKKLNSQYTENNFRRNLCKDTFPLLCNF